ncbi:hypothetical protein DVH24_035767 [Malus domestica]|uniref:Uncharacterized protein n=1 Tax=Malus domestica TaxID=3750 RepID=A0A498JMB4_MALDO|nr:hypothetical protein DVH24_035767 [Malus domestica]
MYAPNIHASFASMRSRRVAWFQKFSNLPFFLFRFRSLPHKSSSCSDGSPISTKPPRPLGATVALNYGLQSFSKTFCTHGNQEFYLIFSMENQKDFFKVSVAKVWRLDSGRTPLSWTPLLRCKHPFASKLGCWMKLLSSRITRSIWIQVTSKSFYHSLLRITESLHFFGNFIGGGVNY